MKAIGGYFELEKTGNGRGFPIDEGILLNTGRNAFEYILRSLPECKKVYLPFYTCDVLLEPLVKCGIPYTFYSVDEGLELASPIDLKENEYLLYTNYFGIKDNYIGVLADQYGEHLIVDCAQALYAKPELGIPTFYSPRKFVGIPDGGIAVMEKGLPSSDFPTDMDSTGRMSHLYLRKEKGPAAGYPAFRENSSKLKMLPIMNMSRETSAMLQTIDFDGIRERRKANFAYLHEKLGRYNLFPIPDASTFACPMVYPFLATREGLREKLIGHQVFVATYWPNVFEWAAVSSIDFRLAKHLLPLPCDQRYCPEEMERIVQLVLEND